MPINPVLPPPCGTQAARRTSGVRRYSDWDEAKHPRAEDGRFGSGGGGGSSGKGEEKLPGVVPHRKQVSSSVARLRRVLTTSKSRHEMVEAVKSELQRLAEAGKEDHAALLAAVYPALNAVDLTELGKTEAKAVLGMARKHVRLEYRPEIDELRSDYKELLSLVQYGRREDIKSVLFKIEFDQLSGKLTHDNEISGEQVYDEVIYSPSDRALGKEDNPIRDDPKKMVARLKEKFGVDAPYEPYWTHDDVTDWAGDEIDKPICESVAAKLNAAIEAAFKLHSSGDAAKKHQDRAKGVHMARRLNPVLPPLRRPATFTRNVVDMILNARTADDLRLYGWDKGAQLPDGRFRWKGTDEHKGQYRTQKSEPGTGRGGKKAAGGDGEKTVTEVGVKPEDRVKPQRKPAPPKVDVDAVGERIQKMVEGGDFSDQDLFELKESMRGITRPQLAALRERFKDLGVKAGRSNEQGVENLAGGVAGKRKAKDAAPTPEPEEKKSAGFDSATEGKMLISGKYHSTPQGVAEFKQLSSHYGVPEDFYVMNQGDVTINEKYDPEGNIQRALDERQSAGQRGLYVGSRKKHFDEKVEKAAAEAVKLARGNDTPTPEPSLEDAVNLPDDEPEPGRSYPAHMYDTPAHQLDALQKIKEAASKDKFAMPSLQDTGVDQKTIRELAELGLIERYGSGANSKVFLGIGGRMRLSAADELRGDETSRPEPAPTPKPTKKPPIAIGEEDVAGIVGPGKKPGKGAGKPADDREARIKAHRERVAREAGDVPDEDEEPRQLESTSEIGRGRAPEDEVRPGRTGVPGSPAANKIDAGHTEERIGYLERRLESLAGSARFGESASMKNERTKVEQELAKQRKKLAKLRPVEQSTPAPQKPVVSGKPKQTRQPRKKPAPPPMPEPEDDGSMVVGDELTPGAGPQKPPLSVPAEPSQEQKPEQKPPTQRSSKPVPGQKSGATPQELGKALKDVHDNLKKFPEFRDGLVPLGDLYAELREKVPDLTKEQFHNMVWQLSRDYKAELHPLNETKDADGHSAEHAIGKDGRMYNYLRLKPEASGEDLVPSKEVGAEKEHEDWKEHTKKRQQGLGGDGRPRLNARSPVGILLNARNPAQARPLLYAWTRKRGHAIRVEPGQRPSPHAGVNVISPEEHMRRILEAPYQVADHYLTSLRAKLLRMRPAAVAALAAQFQED